jgi:hypothetical protein
MTRSVNPSFRPLWLALILLLIALLAASPTGGTAAAEGAGQNPVESPSVLDGPPLYLPLVMGGNGSAAPPSGDFQLLAFSDALRLDPLAEMEADLNMLGPLYCLTNGLPAPATLTLAQARQNAQDYLQQLAGSAAVDGVRSHLANRSLGEIDGFATAAGSAGETEAALAALLVAVERFPAEPMPYVNASGLLSLSGLPNEAIAFLDAAAATGRPYGTPMGVDGAQIAANNRAHALLMRGQWAEAEAILRPVVVAEPQLAEARLNLSRALVCQGDVADAAYWYRMGQRRMVWDTVADGPEIQDRMIPIESLFDTSAGKLPTIPDVPKPARIEQVADYALLYEDMHAAYEARLDAYYAAKPALDQAYYNRTLPFLQQSRLDSIVDAIQLAHRQPALRALWEQSLDLDMALYYMWDDTHQALNELGITDEQCRAILLDHFPQYLDTWYEYEDVHQEYMTLLYATKTGVLANSQDAPLHAMEMHDLEMEMETLRYNSLHLPWSRYIGDSWAKCGDGMENGDETDGEMVTPAAEQCPAGVKGVKLGAEFGIAQISITCEIVEVELSESAPISPFLQVTHDMRKNEATFFFGAKGKVMIGPLLELNAKEGFYVRANQTSITDVGMKTATGGAVHLGGSGISGQLDGPEFEMGVAAAVEYWLGP